MWISLHVGPHKTGTTSIQTFLLHRFGSKAPSTTWYPAPSDRGPGHSLLAFDHLAGGTLLERLVHDAAHAGVEHLILSSEDFSFADADAFERLSFLASYDVRLVVTLSPLRSRVPSLWQEMVKHGHSRSISDSVGQILSIPGMRPDFATSFASGLNPKELSIILVSGSADPHVLIGDLCAALRLGQSAHEFGFSNRSIGYLETELLRHANSLMTVLGVQKNSAAALRDLLLAAIQSNHWQSASPKTKIRTPDEYTREINLITEQTWIEVNDIGKRFSTRIIGYKESFFNESIS